MIILGLLGSIPLLIAIVAGLIVFAAIHYVPILALILGGIIAARVARGLLRGIIAGAAIGVIMWAVIGLLPQNPGLLNWGLAAGYVTWAPWLSYTLLGAIGGFIGGAIKRM